MLAKTVIPAAISLFRSPVAKQVIQTVAPVATEFIRGTAASVFPDEFADEEEEFEEFEEEEEE